MLEPELSRTPNTDKRNYNSMTFAVGLNDGIHNLAGIVFGLIATFSRGNVTIRSADMADAPSINPALLEDPRDQDLAIAVFNLTRRLAAT